MIARSQMVLIGAILGSAVLSFFSSRIDDYVLDVTIGVGINIMLAVSLNLINGYTGQFSLGHAGFMAVGAYTAGALTTHLGPQVVGTLVRVHPAPYLLTTRVHPPLPRDAP